jgi:hypothetical protein
MKAQPTGYRFGTSRARGDPEHENKANLQGALFCEALALAVNAYTATLLDLVALQAYTFDPNYTPIRADELE